MGIKPFAGANETQLQDLLIIFLPILNLDNRKQKSLFLKLWVNSFNATMTMVILV